jgi:thiol-disulfide isomerase/thioredoxin
VHALALLLLVASCSGAPPAARPSSPDPTLEPLPDLTYRLLSGETWSSRDTRGRVVVLDVWATYCKPCRKAFPKLGRLAASSPEVTVLGISVDEDDAVVRRFLDEVPASFVIARDPERTVEAAPLSIRKLPTVILLDRRGRVRFRAEEMAETGYDALSGLVSTLLAE